MGTRHVSELLSAAYDDALTPAERRRYEAHLATCPDCAAESERFRLTINAVHELPAARMPQRVILPSTPPQPERRRGLTLPAWLKRLPRPSATPAWSAGALALTGIAIVVLVARGGSSPTTSSALSQGATAPGLADANKAITAGIGTCPLPLAVLPQSSSAPAQPPGFDNHASVGDKNRPGQQLVLATTSTHYAPGAQVLIYAALTTSTGQHTAVIPCVTLHQQGAVAYAPAQPGSAGGGTAASGPGAAAGSSVTTSPSPCSSSCSVPAQGGTAAQAPAFAGPPAAANSLLSPAQVQAFSPYALLPPLAEASPTAAAVANLPLQVIRIPANATPGTRLQLVALIPSGLPGSADSPALEAVLTLDVS